MFNIVATTANRVFYEVNQRVLSLGKQDVAPRGRPTVEATSAQFTLLNPRDRVVTIPERGIQRRKLFGRMVWELCGRVDLESIAYYDDQALRFAGKDGIIPTAYGARLRKQMPGIVDLLRKDPSSRRAVGLILGADDSFTTRLEYPCAISTQYMIRDGKLDCVTIMRSESTWGVLPYDIAMFTLFQEYVANELGVALGVYTHFMTSAHVYEREVPLVKQMVANGMREQDGSGRMAPFFDGLESIDRLDQMEGCIRNSGGLSMNMTFEAGLSSGGWVDVVKELADNVA